MVEPKHTQMQKAGFRQEFCTPSRVVARDDAMGRTLHERKQGVMQAARSVGKRFADQDLTRFKANWDGDGAEPIMARTWTETCSLVRTLAMRTKDKYGVEIAIPRAIPLHGGSIDMSWKSTQRELTINIPADPSEPIEFYGRGPAPLAIEGHLNTDQAYDQVATWLAARE